VSAVRLTGRRRSRATSGWWPYRPADTLGLPDETADNVAAGNVPLMAVPYYTWGNREPGAMRIWVPTA